MQKDKPSSKAICRDVVFSILQEKSPSYLLNKYKLGRIQGGLLILNPFECLYLFLKGKISAENPVMNQLDKLLGRLGVMDHYLDIFIVYEILKNRGFYVKMEEDSIFYRRSPRDEYSGPVRVIRESENIEFGELIRNGSCIYAALDDDNDVTIFVSELWDLQGLSDFIVASVPEISRLNGVFLVKSTAVPEWYGTLFGEYRILNKPEANYLTGTLLGGIDHTGIQKIFNDLIERKFIVKTGFKYGANFRIYSKSIEEHADYLVHVIDEREQWYKISRAVRVAQGVRKEMVFSGLTGNVPRYVKLKRVKDPFSPEN